jgi:hypothetical protein
VILEDAIVIPKVGVPNQDEILKLGKLRDQLLEELEVVQRSPAVGCKRDLNFRMSELILELVVTEGGVDRNNGCSHRGSSQEHLYPFGAVLEIQRNAITGSDAEVIESRGESGHVPR